MEGQYIFPGIYDAVGVFPNGVPVLLDVALGSQFAGREAGFRVAFQDVIPQPGKFVAAGLQLGKRFRVAISRLGGVTGDLLGKYPKLTGIGDVFLIVLTVLVDDEQNHNEQHGQYDQRCDQAGNKLVGALSHAESSGFVFHLWLPASLLFGK